MVELFHAVTLAVIALGFYCVWTGSELEVSFGPLHLKLVPPSRSGYVAL